MTDPRAGGAPARRYHLDDVTAMLLADGEPAAAAAQTHVAECAACAARVAAFRAEAKALAHALSLNADELAVLFQAQMPRQVAARAVEAGTVPDVIGLGGAAEREPAAPLAALFSVTAAGYAGSAAVWATTGPWLAAIQELGVTSAALQFAIGWVFRALALAWQIVDVLAATPWIQEPALPVLVLAAGAAGAALFGPRFGSDAASRMRSAAVESVDLLEPAEGRSR